MNRILEPIWGLIAVLVLVGLVLALMYLSEQIINEWQPLSAEKGTLTSAMVNGVLTAVLVIVTAIYVRDTHKMLENSQEEKHIERLERSLENFYIPLQVLFAGIDEFCVSGEKFSPIMIWLKKNEVFNLLANYSYLAEPNTRLLYFDCIVEEEFDQPTLEKNLERLLDQVKKDIDDYQTELNELTEYRPKQPSNSADKPNNLTSQCKYKLQKEEKKSV